MLPRPFQGWFVVRLLGLATVNLYTKYEVSMFTHYEDSVRGTPGLGAGSHTLSCTSYNSSRITVCQHTSMPTTHKCTAPVGPLTLTLCRRRFLAVLTPLPPG